MSDQERPLEAPLSDLGQEWSPFPGRAQGQRKGRIEGRRRNSAAPITAGHENRAGHRLYVRVNQPRAFRINIMGFGRWRNRAKHNAARVYGSNAELTSSPPVEPRAFRRLDHHIQYRLDRKARRTRVKIRSGS